MEAMLGLVGLKHEDEEGVTRATIIPSHGANVVSLMFKRHAWRDWVHFLESVDVGALQQRSTSFGMPLLGPLPGRTGRNQSGEFEFAGQSYKITPGRHGFLRDRQWEVVSQQADKIHCRLVVDEPANDATRAFPFAFEANYYVSLRAGGLDCQFDVKNMSTTLRQQPFGLGCHPYLAACGPVTQVRIPAAKYWELDKERERTPTGRLLDVDPRYDFRQWRVVAPDARWDHIFSGLEATGNGADSVVTAATQESHVVHEGDWREEGIVYRELRLPQGPAEAFQPRAFQPMENVQLYVPPGRRAICLEPLSCAPNAVNLANNKALGIREAVLHDSLTFRWSCSIGWVPGRSATPLVASV